jgi:hypothetical protein
MRSRAVVFGLLLAGVSVLAACNGSASSQGYAAVVPCVFPAGTTVTLAYPIPGATGVSDALAQIVVAVSSPLPASWAVVLAAGTAGSTETSLTAIAPNAIPTPYAAPTSSPISYESSSVVSGALPAGSGIAVLLEDTSSTCDGYPQVGTFTTQ